MELKGSKTEKNLQEAFAGESQARNKYSHAAPPVGTTDRARCFMSDITFFISI